MLDLAAALTLSFIGVAVLYTNRALLRAGWGLFRNGAAASEAPQSLGGPSTDEPPPSPRVAAPALRQPLQPELPPGFYDQPVQRQQKSLPVSSRHAQFWRLAAEQPGRSAAELGTKLGLKRRRACQLASELVELGWIDRQGFALYANTQPSLQKSPSGPIAHRSPTIAEIAEIAHDRPLDRRDRPLIAGGDRGRSIAQPAIPDQGPPTPEPDLTDRDVSNTNNDTLRIDTSTATSEQLQETPGPLVAAPPVGPTPQPAGSPGDSAEFKRWMAQESRRRHKLRPKPLVLNGDLKFPFAACWELGGIPERDSRTGETWGWIFEDMAMALYVQGRGEKPGAPPRRSQLDLFTPSGSAPAVLPRPAPPPEVPDPTAPSPEERQDPERYWRDMAEALVCLQQGKLPPEMNRQTFVRELRDLDRAAGWAQKLGLTELAAFVQEARVAQAPKEQVAA